MAKNLELSDFDPLFDGDKRGRQVILIETGNLTHEPLAFSKGLIYGKIHKNIVDDKEYICVRNKIIINSKNDFSEIKATLNDTGKNTFDIIVEYYKKQNKLDLPDCGRGKSIKKFDELLKNLLKEAWTQYKTSSPIQSIASTYDNNDKIIFRNGDNFFVKNNDGYVSELKLSETLDCRDFGLEKKMDEFVPLDLKPIGPDCSIFYKLIKKQNINEFKTTINNYYNIDTTLINQMHPYLALAILNAFKFPVIINKANNLKQIQDFNQWEITEFAKSISVTDETKKYLEFIVNYINRNKYILNPELLNREDIRGYYDVKTKTNRFGQKVDPNSTTKKPIEGLTRYYEHNKTPHLRTTKDLMIDLYEINNLPLPSYLNYNQSGGSPFGQLKDSLLSGKSGYSYLKHVYENLRGSLENVSVDEIDADIKKKLIKLEGTQEALLKYLEFFEKVSTVHELYKLTDADLKFTSTDIESLKAELEKKIKAFRENEELIVRFVEAIEKKEANPDDISSIFE